MFFFSVANIHISKLILLLSGDTNVIPGLATVNNNSITLNTLPFHECSEPSVSFKCESSVSWKALDDCKWKIFGKEVLHKWHLNISSLLPKIDKLCFIEKQSIASISGIIEWKLDSSILKLNLTLKSAI